MRKTNGNTKRYFLSIATICLLVCVSGNAASPADAGRWLREEGGALHFAPDTRHIVLHDEFFYSGNALNPQPPGESTRLGDLGWRPYRVLAQPYEYVPDIVEILDKHPGVIFVMYNPTVYNQPLGEPGWLQASAQYIDARKVKELHAIVRPEVSVAGDVMLKFGLCIGQPSKGVAGCPVVFHYRKGGFPGATAADGSPNWVTITYDHVGFTKADTGVPVVANKWYLLKAAQTVDGVWDFYINDALVATHTTNTSVYLPSYPLLATPTFGVYANLEAGHSARLLVDEFTLITKDLGQRWDN